MILLSFERIFNEVSRNTTESLSRDLRLNTIPITWLLLRKYNCMAGILFLRKSPKISNSNKYYFIIPVIFVNWLTIVCLSLAELKQSEFHGVFTGLIPSLGLIWIIHNAATTSTSGNDASLTLTAVNLVSRLLFGLIGFIIYFLLISIYEPGTDNFFRIGEAPALIYIYILISILIDFLSTLSILADLCSIPFILLLVPFFGLGYWCFQVDYYYQLQQITIQNNRVPLNQMQNEEQKNKKFGALETAFDNRLSNQFIDQSDQLKNERTLVVIAASGGGIQASGWTAQVLGGLQEELGSSFTDATGLISSVSGGAVGTMYFLDAFDQTKGHPTDENSDQLQQKKSSDENSLLFNNQALNKVFKNSTQDWLDAVGWGIASPDVSRITGWGALSVDRFDDRGYALEHDWQTKMSNPKNITTLEDWRVKSINGEIPIPVFNATLVEDGRRFLISPLKLIEGNIKELVEKNGDDKVLDFRTLYPCYDLNVTTAARLSASFPYVSPLPRNYPNISYDLSKENNFCQENESDQENNRENEKKFFANYHVADGGYFDNSGLFTAVELISKDLDYIDKEQGESKTRKSIIKELNIKRILLLEINASPESQLGKGSKGDRGWFVELIGPLTAAYTVRDSTQISRNLKEVELLKKLEKNPKVDVDIESFTIFFPEGYNQPLSWRLTKQQKKNMKLAWDDVKKTPTFKELKQLWKETWGIPPEFEERQRLQERQIKQKS